MTGPARMPTAGAIRVTDKAVERITFMRDSARRLAAELDHDAAGYRDVAHVPVPGWLRTELAAANARAVAYDAALAIMRGEA